MLKTQLTTSMPTSTPGQNMVKTQLTTPMPTSAAGYRLPYHPFLQGVDQPNVVTFQGTLKGKVQKGVIENSNAANADVFADSKLPYASLNYMNNAQSSSAFLHNTGCRCPGHSMNIDNACVGGAVETMPFMKKTPFQEQYMASLLHHEPFMPINQTEVATMIRAAPLPLGSI